MLSLDLGIAVRRHRVQRAGLVDHVIARQAVIAARRGKQKALDPGILRKLGHMHAAAMIDGVSDIGVEIAERVVGQRCEVNDGVNASEVFLGGVAHILADMRHHCEVAAGGEGALLIKIAVEADDLVARLQQHGHHHGSDIAKMSGNQYAHHYYSSAP